MKRPNKKISSELLNSLRILNIILDDGGNPLEAHILFQNNWAIANNGVIAIGEKVLEDLLVAPNADLLEQAIARCGETVAITQLEQKLSIRSGKFRALVPCLPFENMPRSNPDPAIAPVNDRLKASISAVSCLAQDGADHILAASLLIHGGCVTATDRKVILQHWHGIDLPPNLVVPKALIAPMVKNQKKLAQFGYGNSSCTFYYEDETWLKTQYFATPWPEVNHILDRPSNQWPLPEGFYEAVKALEPFSEDGFVYFDTGKMLSHSDEAKGASYEIYGLPKGPIMSIKQLKMVEPFIKTIDFMANGPNGHMIMFNGDACRGAIAGRTQ